MSSSYNMRFHACIFAFVALVAFVSRISAQEMFTCADGPFQCNDDTAKICASNGVTYQNHCHFFTAYCADQTVMFVKEGDCDGGDSPPPGYESSSKSNNGDDQADNEEGSANSNGGMSAPVSSSSSSGSSGGSPSHNTGASSQSAASKTTMSLAAFVLALGFAF